MVLVHSAFTHSQAEKQNRENRIKNACLLNSHSNIAASNDKRPLFVQIPATSSASLVSTSLPIQCLRPSNFFFFRGIFAYNFLPNLSTPRPEPITTTSERITTTSEPIRIRSEPIRTTSSTYHNRFGTYSDHLPNVFQPPRNVLRGCKFAPGETRFACYICALN